MNNNDNIVLHLSFIKGIGPSFIKRLTNEYQSDISQLYLFEKKDFIERYFLTDAQAEILHSGLRNNSLLEEELSLLSKEKASFVTPYNEAYPCYLKKNTLYPPILYFKSIYNRLNINEYTSLSIVSSRKTNLYGQRVIKEIIEGLTYSNIIVISGGAIGGDTYIHQAAVNNNIPTGVILGSGLSHLYPQCNKKLFEIIIEKGGFLMSQFPLNTQASPITFPIRNSVIAGVAKTLLVIQAGEKSGTLITANYALDYGRDVAAVPGQIDDIIMKESNNLIKQGAHCITQAKDVLDLLGIKKKEDKAEKEQKKNTECSLIQKKILELCKDNPQSVEELSLLLEMKIPDIYIELFFLLEKKYIKDNILGCWATI